MYNELIINAHMGRKRYMKSGQTSSKTCKVFSGFTLIELLVVVAIISLLSSVIVSSLSGMREEAYLSRAQSEMDSFHSALLLYVQDNNGNFPDDTNRGKFPDPLKPYFNLDVRTNDDGEWVGPWSGSLYDWENYENNGEQVLQLSIRFCELDAPDTCQFPNATWAENFDTQSSVYYCIEGPCKPHPSEPEDHPGLCVNC